MNIQNYHNIVLNEIYQKNIIKFDRLFITKENKKNTFRTFILGMVYLGFTCKI